MMKNARTKYTNQKQPKTTKTKTTTNETNKDDDDDDDNGITHMKTHTKKQRNNIQ